MPKKTKQQWVLPLRVSKSITSGLRIDIQRILSEVEASPNDLSKMLGEGLSRVSYHVRELRKNEAIRQVRTEQRRGAIEHYYRAAEAPHVTDQEAAKLKKPIREEITAVMLQAIFREAVGALESGTFDSRTDRHLSWMPMPLGEQGVEEALTLLLETMERLQEISATDAERREESGEEAQEFLFAMMGYERSENPARFDREGKPIS
ncbi:MAG TPA: winged helix-turn-helix domain-containing protein [Solirubrobacterales bacterium]|nr:winged helix-turn-helix domain-containing protein [Solirubrobacterales bacterium]